MNSGSYGLTGQSTTLTYSAAGGAFTPDLIVNFDGLSDTQAVYGSGSVAGKRWDGVSLDTPYANGFGMRATTSVKMPGKTSSCALSIAAGSDGDPAGGDTGVGMGAFGGTLDIPGGGVSEGEELWWGQWIYFPTGWRWDSQTSQSLIKFMRLDHHDDTAHLDLYILNGNYEYYGNTDSSSAAPSEQSGFWYVNEYGVATGNTEPATKITSTGITLNQWVWVEQYIYAHSNASLAKRRLWVDGVFAREQIGAAVKWRANDGQIKTITAPSGERTLASSTDFLTLLRQFTYWNSYAPQNQTCYIQAILAHKNASTLPDADEFGNPMIGNNTI